MSFSSWSESALRCQSYLRKKQAVKSVSSCWRKSVVAIFVVNNISFVESWGNNYKSLETPPPLMIVVLSREDRISVSRRVDTGR